MSARRLLRIVLSLGVIAVLWTRVISDWHGFSGPWVIGSITISLLLLLVVVAEISGARQKGHRPSDRVPKRPLGLDS